MKIIIENKSHKSNYMNGVVCYPVLLYGTARWVQKRSETQVNELFN